MNFLLLLLIQYAKFEKDEEAQDIVLTADLVDIALPERVHFTDNLFFHNSLALF